jgi:hypothetical protein
MLGTDPFMLCLDSKDPFMDLGGNIFVSNFYMKI